MERMIPELLDMRARALPGSVSRQLADRCLELCFQEITANDEAFGSPPMQGIEDFIESVVADIG